MVECSSQHISAASTVLRVAPASRHVRLQSRRPSLHQPTRRHPTTASREPKQAGKRCLPHLANWRRLRSVQPNSTVYVLGSASSLQRRPTLGTYTYVYPWPHQIKRFLAWGKGRVVFNRVQKEAQLGWTRETRRGDFDHNAKAPTSVTGGAKRARANLARTIRPSWRSPGT